MRRRVLITADSSRKSVKRTVCNLGNICGYINISAVCTAFDKHSVLNKQFFNLLNVYRPARVLGIYKQLVYLFTVRFYRTLPDVIAVLLAFGKIDFFFCANELDRLDIRHSNKHVCLISHCFRRIFQCEVHGRFFFSHKYGNVFVAVPLAVGKVAYLNILCAGGAERYRNLGRSVCRICGYELALGYGSDLLHPLVHGKVKLCRIVFRCQGFRTAQRRYHSVTVFILFL